MDGRNATIAKKIYKTAHILFNVILFFEENIFNIGGYVTPLLFNFTKALILEL